jgi:hypothetical protein
MSGLVGAIMIRTTEYRPCYVGGKKALFHKWEDVSEIVEPSIMKGGHGGGVVKGTLAIVELEDGTIKRVTPHIIQFADNKIKEYAFNEGEKERNEGK